MLVKYSTGGSSLPKPKNWKRRLLVLLQGEMQWYEASEVANRSSRTVHMRVERQLGKIPVDDTSKLNVDADPMTGLPFTFVSHHLFSHTPPAHSTAPSWA